MPPFQTVPLRRLLILLTALGLLPLAIIGAWGIYAAIAQQRQDLERSMLDLSRALALAVEAELDATIGALRTMSYNPNLTKGNLIAFYDIASEAVRVRPEWSAVVLTDGDGKVIFTTARPLGARDADQSVPDSLMRAIATRAPAVGRIAKSESMPASVPVRVPLVVNGGVRYVLTAAVRPDRIVDIVRRQNVPQSWVISVHDATLLRVARSKDHERTVATGVSPTLAELMANRKREGSGTSRTLDGVEAITAYTRIPQYGWAVVIGAPTAHLKETLIQSFAVYAAAIAASLGLCIALSIAISRRIVTAIDGLQAQAARLGHGQPVQIAPNRIHEVNQMGEALQTASRERLAVEQEREKLMASLTQALARAEDAARAKDDFLAVLGHELRNPLAPMVTALDLMDLRGDSAHVRERQIMRRQVGHMKRLVDDLLDVSRITQGKLDIRKAPVNLRVVAERAVEAMQPAVAARGRDIVVQAPADVWVDGDETRLVQVVANLLANALRFDPDGEIAVRVNQDADQACITVSDQGAGMPADTLERIFQPFYQAPQSLARKSGGLGLGLAIVQSIVRLHDGSVAAYSAGSGQGSRFEVRLPATNAHGASTQDAPSRLPHGAARVLVVDDNLDAAQTLADMLRLAGHEVQVAHSAQSALAMAPGFSPQVAILDIGLPDMDGFELARALRSRLPSWQGQLIALTGYGQQADKERAAEAGFARHLTKPVDTDDLFDAISG